MFVTALDRLRLTNLTWLYRATGTKPLLRPVTWLYLVESHA